MSVVRIFTPENRLAKTLGGACDPTLDQIARAADARVAELGEGLRAHIREQRELILRLAGQDEAAVFADSKAIGDAALAICEIAGAAGLTAVGDMARGVYAMVDALVRKGVWHTEALRLHIDALALLDADAEPPAAATAQILARLKAMRDWVGVEA